MVQKHPRRQRTETLVAAPAFTGEYAPGLARLLAALFLAATLAAALFAAKARAGESENIRLAKALSNAYGEVVERVSPAVVGIQTERKARISRSPDFLQHFFDLPGGPGGPEDFFEFRDPRRRRPQRQPEEEYEPNLVPGAVGTGIVIDAQGHILTNNHVISNAEGIKVQFAADKNKTYKAEVVGRDPNSDLAVIKLIDPPADLPFATLGDSDALKPGNTVIAIGSPFGLYHSISTGVVSATGRNLNEIAYERFIQTDAAINPGNSGGPMVNLDAEVVGVNTLISTPTGAFAGVGFAIPINQAKRVLTQLIATGSVTRGWLGIQMNPDDPEVSVSLGHSGTGVVVQTVDPNGPAAKAGLRPYDLIISFDGVDIKDNEDLRYRVAEMDPGHEIRAVILRDRERMDVTITIDAQPEDLFTRAERSQGGRGGDMHGGQKEVSSSLGITVTNITDGARQRFRIADEITDGVVIMKVDDDSEAHERGLRRGMVITEMDRKPVPDIAAFRQILKDSVGKEKILLSVYFGNASRYLTLKLK